ncbi:unnamed protein product [Cuscuta europaea]|uniref:Chromo domain-containing protein n=1 Tax=Cuscuta europaea TaxID=41803 RepID=A0A9P0ZD66_CUSEU|nr:unnamed protein product [Cuscuta europaea]
MRKPSLLKSKGRKLSGGKMRPFGMETSLAADSRGIDAVENDVSAWNPLDCPAEVQGPSEQQHPEKSDRAAAPTEDGERDSSGRADDMGEQRFEEAADGAVNVGQIQRNQLGEGFYDLEAIRKKRIRQGKVQYLIKWRGWPESTNTWEPIENLAACPDVIDAFEKRSRYKKRGRKQKSNTSNTESTKKQRSSTPASTNDNTSHSAPPASKKNATTRIETRQSRQLSAKTVKGKAQATSSLDESGSSMGNQLHNTLSSGRVSERSGEELNEGLVITNGSSLSSEQAQVPGDFVPIEAKRRKGPVSRFLKDLSADASNDVPEKMVRAPGTSSSSPVAKEDYEDGCSITEIVDIFKFDDSASNYTTDVLEIFLVKRSDGKEVMANKGFLKENYTSLLIDFYEKLLRKFIKARA